ncbi:MAG: DUF2179 domain-containing protein [Dethiobacter sp.]|nr:DUF2179 domain-containing protein [Dethiobacter sp.]MBS3902503.1 DUF2179 domain-containing protein [Dethiobacter sp.]MBS3989914.1 DUF2179 domain-containing protein [Dethiobacter sp.]MBS3990413.1 DUF2179 domain-containing protein [Dethiobacter sp.]
MMWLPLFFDYAFIFFARVSDVTLSTVRILMLMRGRSVTAAAIGFFEVSIYVLALSRVIDSLDQPLRLIVYALGFATGNLLGSRAEEYLALGFTTAEVISVDKAGELAEKMRECGFGVTVLQGCGLTGTHQILHVLLKRRNMPSFLGIIREVDDKAFVSLMDTRKIVGGYFAKIKSK